MREDSLFIWLALIVIIISDVVTKQIVGATAGVLTFIIIISLIDAKNVKDKLSFGLWK